MTAKLRRSECGRLTIRGAPRLAVCPGHPLYWTRLFMLTAKVSTNSFDATSAPRPDTGFSSGGYGQKRAARLRAFPSGR